jgi:hypothetical protein
MITRYREFTVKESIETDTDALYDFIQKDKGSVITLLHTTSEESAKNIIENGLKYYQLDKTTDQITSDKVTLDYNLMIRKAYGNCTVIIQFKKDFWKNIEDLSSVKPYQDEESGETVYTLPKEFVKGYFNRKTGEIVKNPNFDPLHTKKELELA